MMFEWRKIWMSGAYKNQRNEDIFSYLYLHMYTRHKYMHLCMSNVITRLSWIFWQPTFHVYAVDILTLTFDFRLLLYCNLCWSIILKDLSSRWHKVLFRYFQPVFVLECSARWCYSMYFVYVIQLWVFSPLS